MIANDIDLGGLHAEPKPDVGQAMDSYIIQGKKTKIFSKGSQIEAEDLSFWVTAWRAIGGQSAGTEAAVRLLLTQLEELAANDDMQPSLLLWRTTTQPNYPNAFDTHDGWYLFGVKPDYSTYARSGMVRVELTASKDSHYLNAPLTLYLEGDGYASGFTALPTVSAAFPFGSSSTGILIPRTGGEGAVPYYFIPDTGPRPIPFVPSSTLSDLFKGGVRCYDTMTAGGNAVDTTGTGVNAFVHQNWVQIYGPDHNLSGDLVITNGLALLRFNMSGTGSPSYYLWNTQLGTPAWQLIGNLNYRDSVGLNTGSIRAIDLQSVGLQQTEVVVTLSSSAGNFAYLTLFMNAGHYEVPFLFEPNTEDNTRGLGVEFVLSTAIKVVANDSAVVDVATQGTTSLTPSSTAGWSVAIGTNANQCLAGLLWQNPPNNAQPLAQSTTEIGIGDTTTPLQSTAQLYAMYAVPYVTSPNLLAEGESGSLGTGWTSAADAGSSGGNAAKNASGTLTGNADLFGATWIPTAGSYDLWMRMRVASAASGVNAWQAGLWDRTSSAFVGATTNWAPSGIGTSYVWKKVATNITPTAAHNMGYRIVTTATTTTDLFVDQAVLVPKASATLGAGNLPADINSQFLGTRRGRLIRAA